MDRYHDLYRVRGFRSADAQVKGKHSQHKTTSAKKHIPKNARIDCKYVDSDDRPLAHVKVTAGIEHTETDEHGLFDIANPFTETTQMVAVNFEENGTYKYGQLARQRCEGRSIRVQVCKAITVAW